MRSLKRFLATVAATTIIAVTSASLVTEVPIASDFAAPPPPVPTATQNGYFVNLDAVKHIFCARKNETGVLVDYDSGTGSVISHNKVLTAAHVVADTDACTIDGKPAVVSYLSGALDVAVLTVDLGDSPIMPISCEGFHAGETYFAIGWAQGQDFAIQTLTATGEHRDVPTDELPIIHGAIFTGRDFSGMSGGPVVDIHGRVTGIVNAGSDRWSVNRELSDTPLCTMLNSVSTAK